MSRKFGLWALAALLVMMSLVGSVFSSPAQAAIAVGMVYGIEIGDCQTSGTRPVTASFMNVYDDEGEPFVSPGVRAVRLADGLTVNVVDDSVIVPDTEVYFVEIGNHPDPTQSGLLPGTWRFDFLSNGQVMESKQHFLSRCAGVEPPPGDGPGGPGTNNPPESKPPKGMLKRIPGTSKVRVRAVNLVQPSATFQLVVNPKRGKTKKANFVLYFGGDVSTTCGSKSRATLPQAQKIKRACINRPGTIYVLKTKMKVDDKRRWVKLARVVIRHR